MLGRLKKLLPHGRRDDAHLPPHLRQLAPHTAGRMAAFFRGEMLPILQGWRPVLRDSQADVSVAWHRAAAAKQAERERIAGILALDEAAERMALAVKLATTTELPVEQARDLLAAAPTEKHASVTGDPASPLGLELTTAATQQSGDDVMKRWDAVLERISPQQAN